MQLGEVTYLTEEEGKACSSNDRRPSRAPMGSVEAAGRSKTPECVMGATGHSLRGAAATKDVNPAKSAPCFPKSTGVRIDCRRTDLRDGSGVPPISTGLR